MARPRKAQAALVAARRADALQLRVTGAGVAAIGRALAADPALNSTGVAYPMGYGNERYHRGQEAPTLEDLARLAAEDISRACAQNEARADGAAGELVMVESSRLEQLHEAYWPAALDSDAKAFNAVMRVMERRSKLLGLDAPVRAELALSRNDQDVDAEIELILAGLGEGPPEETAGATWGQRRATAQRDD